jgi:hypothetical protein
MSDEDKITDEIMTGKGNAKSSEEEILNNELTPN